MPSKVRDVWEATGRARETEHTWDTSVNHNLAVTYKAKCRFDRFYCSGVAPLAFDLWLRERIAVGLFPSDHWGIVADFDVE